MVQLYALPVADAGIPTLAIHWPLMIFLLPVVILIETLVAKPILQLQFWSTAIRITVANVFSTLIGIPVAWIVMVIVNESTMTEGYQSYKFGSVWELMATMFLHGSGLYPDMNQGWMLAAATLGMMLPYFIISFLSEWLVLRLMTRTVKPALIWKAAWRANFVSYLLLISLSIYWFISDVRYAM